MWNRVLVRREARQARAFLWMIPLIHFMVLGLARMNLWLLGSKEAVDSQVSWRNTMELAYVNGNFESSSRLVLSMLILVLALVQIGAERRNGTQELLFSLPYSRRQIFASKWLFGAGLLTGSLVLNTVIDMIVMASSPVAGFFSPTYHLIEFSYSWLVLVAFYSLALMIGAVSGSIASQSVFSVIIFVLPAGLLMLVDEFLRINRVFIGADYYPLYRRMEDYWNPLNYLFVQYSFISWKHVILMLLLLIVALISGVIAYERNRTENNGKLVLFVACEWILQIGFVICCSLLSAVILSGALTNELQVASYYVGLVAGAILSYFIIRRLTLIRLKI